MRFLKQKNVIKKEKKLNLKINLMIYHFSMEFQFLLKNFLIKKDVLLLWDVLWIISLLKRMQFAYSQLLNLEELFQSSEEMCLKVHYLFIQQITSGELQRILMIKKELAEDQVGEMQA